MISRQLWSNGANGNHMDTLVSMRLAQISLILSKMEMQFFNIALVGALLYNMNLVIKMTRIGIQ